MASLGGGSFSSGMLIAGKYRLQKQLGEGAMGVVWSAMNTGTGGLVALKLIARSDQELQTRLLREARACGQIRHKNVVQVYDVGTTESGDPFLVMELLQGETLAALLARKRRLPPSEAAAIARDVARALSAAHAGQIIHRDLKPANIFLHTEPGEDVPVVKVVDFGVSKNLAQSDGLRTIAGGAVGSPMYMSPEQARADRDVDYRADLWSLGVVLYEMLAGERPFLGDANEVLVKIAAAPIPRVARRVRKIDPDLDRIVAGCLTRDREARLQPAAEIAKQLEIHALPAPREPLPSLMDTGGYDAPAVATPGSGNAAFSPGSGPTSLQAQSSPGSGRTELRPSSDGAALRGSGPASGSGGGALHRSGSWGDRRVDDDDIATRPLDPKMLAPRVTPEPADDEWGRGGTIPIHPQQAALAVAMSRPAPPAPPPPPSSSAGVAPQASAPLPPQALRTTIPMETVQLPPRPGMGGTQPMSPAQVAPPPPRPSQVPAKKRPDKAMVAAIGVTLVAAAAALVVWRATSKRGEAEATSLPTAASVEASAPGAPTGNTYSSQAVAVPAPPPASTPSTTTSSAVVTPPPAASTAVATPPKTPVSQGTSTTKPAGTASTKPAGTSKPAGASTKSAGAAATGTKKKCDKFHVCQ